MRFVVFTLAMFAGSIACAAESGIAVTVGEPGFYGRIEIGDVPHPELIYKQPMIVKPVVGVAHAPIYLHVPPGHAKDWPKHCAKYQACGERVYFVHDHWYNDVYVPEYRKRHGKAGKGHDKKRQ